MCHRTAHNISWCNVHVAQGKGFLESKFQVVAFRIKILAKLYGCAIQSRAHQNLLGCLRITSLRICVNVTPCPVQQPANY